jgi:hypothetical protein
MPVIFTDSDMYVTGTTLTEDLGLAPGTNLPIEPRIGVMFGILLVSLLGTLPFPLHLPHKPYCPIFNPTAVSFPGISKKVSFLRIPHLVFFIGKHFGTGVYVALVS